SPVLSVQTFGPQRISVGKESAYEVVMENAGDVAADEVVVFVELPQWTDVVGAEPQAGTAGPAAGGPVQWKIGHLPAKSRQRLSLRIVPRESRPFDLAVRWDYRPVTSQAMIEVQEPKLVLNLDGPSEVLYGEKEVYRMKISNTGTGPAENVMVRLLPVGSGTNQPISHNLGNIAAGDDKAIEVELIARQVGNLTIRVEVQGDAGVQAELAHEVLVRRAALQVSVEGPKVLYVGTMAGYLVRVGNPGTAPAKNVTLVAGIPPGAKYLTGIDGAQLVANGTKLQWTLPNLNPGNEQSYLMKCHLGLPGSSQLEIRATAEGDLSDTAAILTRVEAIADLMLEVKDPAGPVAVGDEAVYELRIRNRGTKSAQNVEVVTFFSDGIEPTKVEGSPYQVNLGQIAFSPITSVAAGEDVVLKVHAKAGKPGNHIFRAEVHCKTLGTRLVSEETTHFYQNEPSTGFAPAEGPVEKRESPAAEAVRTAERPIPRPAAYPLRPGEPTPAVRP
ncbi:MAG TPA: CARDB domain-containing protein, partial [Thermoguttaceae bacterium]|nr:CARDB domain-containing protein [Thermoguttaceae bacterium]